MAKRYLRIHGDNIIECERSLELLSHSLGINFNLTSNALYRPIFEGTIGDTSFCVELLSGHNRWGVNIANVLMENGGVLREGADSYITEKIENKETILLGIEYCSALPAGNNAWQRNGRAYSSIMSGVPYLYYAELGGVELDAHRKVKAPRFPNPVVPFSYITTSSRLEKFCIPVYTPHPSITQDLYSCFKNVFGLDDSLSIIKGILLNIDYSKALESLCNKGIEMVKLLSAERKSIDTFKGDEWVDLIRSENISKFLQQSKLIWKKNPPTEKVALSETYKILHEWVQALSCKTIGANSLPICIVPNEKRNEFDSILHKLYPNLKFNIDREKELIIVWITGFKPRGDDSRPDRGLSPLVKMIAGDSSYLLAIVSGPAKTSTWEKLKESREALAKDNGLWQSIINICDYVLVDSKTCDTPLFYEIAREKRQNTLPVRFPVSNAEPIFGEHDTDTVIHNIFSRHENLGIKESLCNPPGGDWSGISYYNNKGSEYRWTSLPRVTMYSKRPDHLIQIDDEKGTTFVIIESKQKGSDLENEIGNRLKTYIVDLFSTLPTAYRDVSNDWRLFNESSFEIGNFNTISVGAFKFYNEKELSKHLTRGNLDAIFAFEFGEITTLHILSSSKGNFLVKILEDIQKTLPNLKIHIYSL